MYDGVDDYFLASLVVKKMSFMQDEFLLTAPYAVFDWAKARWLFALVENV